MFCNQCGSKVNDNENFCANCGAPISSPAPIPTEAIPPQALSDTLNARGEPTASPYVTLCSDGKYRWIYEMSLFRNPAIFLLIWKIFFFITLGICAFTLILDAANGYLDGERLPDTLKIFGYVFLGMTALVVLGYLLYAAIMGGKYIVLFEMDDKGINHAQEKNQARKARKIGEAAALIGAAGGNLSTVGVGLNAQRTEMYSEFAKVKKVKAYPRRHLIKVNATLDHNQVYAQPEDFDFVLRYICDRVPESARPKNL